MEALLYFALWAAAFFLMTRLGCGAHVMGGGHGKADRKSGDSGGETLRRVPPKKDTDPVCSKTVITETAKPSVFEGQVYYFCSRECREIFEAAPDLYVGSGTADRPRLEQSHA